MKQPAVRASIIIIICGILLCAAFSIILSEADTDHYQKLDTISQQLDAAPSSKHLRKLLNYPADGAYSYYQMALIGAAFSKHPDIFRRSSQDLQTDRERENVRMLAQQGAGVFEYHPNLKPPKFDDRIHEQIWLKSFQVTPTDQ